MMALVECVLKRQVGFVLIVMRCFFFVDPSTLLSFLLFNLGTTYRDRHDSIMAHNASFSRVVEKISGCNQWRHHICDDGG